jgi:hypothetical protein
VLRAYVAAAATFPFTAIYIEGQALRDNAPALLAHVERLETALTELAEADMEWNPDPASLSRAPLSHRLIAAREAVMALGREIAERRWQ